MQSPEDQLQSQPQAQLTPPPQMVVKWYYKKWFVVLTLILFFPVGLILLWKSPVTKTSGRIVWTVLVALAVIIRLSSGGSGDQPSTGAGSTTTPSSTPKPAAPPKDDFAFKFTDKSSGKVFKGKVASNVGIALLGVSTTKSVGTNDFAKKTASGGATFVVVKIAVNNDQKDAITMDGSLFKLLADGREYSYSTEAMTALMMDDSESFFLKQINPGLTAIGSIAFEVPESVKLDAAQLQFRGGITGKTETLPLKPITE